MAADGTPEPEPEPAPDPAPDHAGLLAELASLVRQIAANSDRHIGEAVEWLRHRGM